MKSVALNAYPRTEVRRRGASKLRKAGRVPAVIYGRQVQPQNLELIRKDLERIMHHSVSETKLVDLAIQGDARPSRLALVQSVQHDPLRGHVLHVDLHEVAESETVTVLVPVETIGEAAGVKTGGGVLEHVLFKVRVRALPRDLPEYIQIDVSNLELNQTIHLRDVSAPPGVEILGDKNIPVVSIAVPREIVEETPVEGAVAPAPAEVEMIKEKKPTEEAKAPAPRAAPTA